MKFIRLLLPFILWPIALAAFLLLLTFSPIVQTWGARLILKQHPSLSGSLGSLSARYGRVEVETLHIETAGTVIDIPSISARLPVAKTITSRKVAAERLIAKGWTIDISRKSSNASSLAAASVQNQATPATPPGTPPSPIQFWLGLFHSALTETKFPFDASFGILELEGDILCPSHNGKAPIKLHVEIKGNEIGTNRENSLKLQATAESMDATTVMAYTVAQGVLTISMDETRAPRRLAFKGNLIAKGESLPLEIAYNIDASATRNNASEDAYSIELFDEGRSLASLLARVPSAEAPIRGSWKIALRDSDVAALFAKRKIPSIAVVGEGNLTADKAFTQINAKGKLLGIAGGFGAIAPALGSVAKTQFAADFDMCRGSGVLRFDRLDIILGGERPIAVVRSLQPFTCNERTGHLGMTAPSSDWFSVTLDKLPIAWLSGLFDDFTFSAGSSEGQFFVKPDKEGFLLQTKTPFNATGVAVQRSGKPAAQNLDLSVSFSSKISSDGWEMNWKPFTIATAGKQLLSSEGKASRALDSSRPLTMTGTWSADLKALANQSAIPSMTWVSANSASGDFSATLGAASKAEGKINITGPEPDKAIAASFRIDTSFRRPAVFEAPIKITLGKSTSEITAAGTWIKEWSGGQASLRLTSKDTSLEHLRELQGPFAATVGARIGNAPNTGPDKTPFWGDWTAHVSVAFERFSAFGEDVKFAEAIFEIDNRSLRLESATWEFANRNLAAWKGDIAFDAKAATPYTLKATSTVAEIDAAPLFGKVPRGKDPIFTGRFSGERLFSGTGINLDDLTKRTNQEFRLKSKAGGIVRLLKTNIAASIPEDPSPRSETLKNAGKSVGNAFGSLFGMRRGPQEDGPRQDGLSKSAEHILEFTYMIAEFRYDQMNITATLGTDKILRVVDFSMTGPEIKASGTGEIDCTKSDAFSTQPLSMDLKLSIRGKMAGLLSRVDLLSKEADPEGYSLIGQQPIHFGGTLQNLDKAQWHDLLLKTVIKKTEEEKKAAAEAAAKK